MPQMDRIRLNGTDYAVSQRIYRIIRGILLAQEKIDRLKGYIQVNVFDESIVTEIVKLEKEKVNF